MKKIISVLMALLLTLTACAALSENDITKWNLPDDILVQYSDIIAMYYDAMNDLASGLFSDEEMEEIRSEFYMAFDSGCFGYALKDLDGDGFPELIFATKTDDPFFQNMVLEMHTVKDGEVMEVFKGWERNRYYYAGENRFAHEGSSGADDSFQTTEAFEAGEMKDLGYVTDAADYVQLDVEVITVYQE